MPQGFFTIEQWKRPAPKAEAQWIAVEHLNAGHTLSDAMRRVEQMGTAGFFRVQKVERMVWAENVDGKMKLRKWQSRQPETVQRSGEALVRSTARWAPQKERKASRTLKRSA